MTLLEETIETLNANGKSEKDVLWCGGGGFCFSWEEFKSLADHDYDSGYGSQEVTTDLIIVGKNFWLERHEYDGSEWWEFKELPKKPKKTKVPASVFGRLWSKLADCK